MDDRQHPNFNALPSRYLPVAEYTIDRIKTVHVKTTIHFEIIFPASELAPKVYYSNEIRGMDYRLRNSYPITTSKIEIMGLYPLKCR